MSRGPHRSWASQNYSSRSINKQKSDVKRFRSEFLQNCRAFVSDLLCVWRI